MRNHIILTLALLTVITVWITGCSDGWNRREEIDLSPPEYCRYPAPLLAPEYTRLTADGDGHGADTAGSTRGATEDEVSTGDSGSASEGQVFIFGDEEIAPESEEQSIGVKDDAARECVNINNDSAEALTRLPGVGQRRAEQIVALRESRPFTRLRHLRRVKGIGRKTVQKLAPLVCPL